MIRPDSIEPVDKEIITRMAKLAPKPAPRQLSEGSSEATVIERAAAYMEKVEPAIAGQAGDRVTFRTACTLVNDFGLDDESAYQLLADWNLRCSPPWEEWQLRDKIKHARSYAKKTPGNLADQRIQRKRQKKADDKKATIDARRSSGNLTLREIFNPARNTDLGNAERLISGAAGKIRHSSSRGWYAWEGKYWIPDEAVVQQLYHKHVIKALYTEVEGSYGQNDSELTKALIGWAKKSENSGVMRSSIAMASGMKDVVLSHDEIDRDPWLMSCENGTIDLKTGKLKDHDPADMITRISNVKHDSAAKCPLWESFLQDIFQDPLLIEYIQLAIGYSLTGDTREQCMFIMHGTGQNGKSVFSNILSALLGTYAMETPAETLMRGRESSSNQPTNDVARLAGARVVSANETEEGQALAESKIKAMTGDDIIIARFLHKEFFEFRPQFKIWMRTNHKPKIRGTDTGIWRRIHLIPFKVTIPAEKRDPELTKKLMAELPGILNWAVEGCLTWQLVGLKAPPVVMAATDDYRTSQDLIGQFLSETCEICPQRVSGMVKGKELYKAYTDWCEEAGERPMPHRVLSIKLTERGFVRRRAFQSRIVVWDGLRLIDDKDRAKEEQKQLYGGAYENS